MGDVHSTWQSRRALEPLCVLLLVQALLGTATVYLTYRLGREFGGRRVGLLAGAFQAITPVAVAALLARVLTETPYTLLFCRVALGDRAPPPYRLVAVAGPVGRPDRRRLLHPPRPASQMAGLYAPRCPAVPFAPGSARGCFCNASAGPPSASVAFVVLIAVALAPWVVRNAVRADYRGFSSFATDSLFRYHAAWALAQEENLSVEEARAWLEEYEASQPRKDSIGLEVDHRAGHAKELTLRHPTGVAWAHVKGTVGFWLPGATDMLELGRLRRGATGYAGCTESRRPVGGGAALLRRRPNGDDAGCPAGAGVSCEDARRGRLRRGEDTPADVGGSMAARGDRAGLGAGGGGWRARRGSGAGAPILSMAAAVGWMWGCSTSGQTGEAGRVIRTSAEAEDRPWRRAGSWRWCVWVVPHDADSSLNPESPDPLLS